VVLAEAAGRVGYELLDQPMHDFNGLADPYIAKHGILVSPFGRIDLRYTIDDVHPTVMVFHGGTVHFLGMLAASTRNSGADYDLYSVGPVTDLSGPFMLLAVEDDAAARLLPRLEDLDLHRITVSG
jgi:hypothetical protein